MFSSSIILASSLVAGAFAASRTTPPEGSIVVAKSGGDFTSLQEAVDSITSSGAVIFMQPGTYEEQVLIEDIDSLTIYGYTEDDQDYSRNEVILTNNLGADEAGSNDASGTLRAKSDGFKLYNVNVVNSRGEGVQAIALSAQGTEQAYYASQFLGYQDTVLSNEGYHYFHGSYIEGATDFIFGQRAVAWFESCTIGISGDGYITASGRDSEDNESWYVLNQVTVEAVDGVEDASTVLGRPWREYARVVVQNSNLGAVVKPEGWSAWGENPTDNVYYGEFGNTGEGASGERVSFAQELSSAVLIEDILGSTSWLDADYVSGASAPGEPTPSPVASETTPSPVLTTLSTVVQSPTTPTTNVVEAPSSEATPVPIPTSTRTSRGCSRRRTRTSSPAAASTLLTVTRSSSPIEVSTSAAAPVVPEESAASASVEASATGAVPSPIASAAPGGDDCSGTPDGFASLNGGTTGGSGGEVVVVTTQEELEEYAGAEGKYVIKVQGVITITPKGTEVKVSSDKTIVGIGDDAEINEGGFNLQNQRNVILRNIKIGNTYVEGDEEGKTQDWDGIQMDNCTNIWIDHVHLERGGDGLIDSRKDTTFLTVSWTILRNHNKAFGIGWTDNVVAELTVHHTFFDETTQRNPSTDNVLHAHMYNNYLVGQTSYGHYARGGTSMRLENCYFENVNDPITADDTASLYATGSVFDGTSGDAAENSGDVFDPTDFYEYTVDAAEDVPGIVSTGAGRQASICPA